MALARLRRGPRAAAWEVFWKREQAWVRVVEGPAWAGPGRLCGPCRRCCSALPLLVQLDLKDTAIRSPPLFL